MVAPTKQLPTQTAAMEPSVTLHPYLTPPLDDQATGFCFTHFLNHVIFSTNVISQFSDQTADVWRWGVDDRLLTSLKTIGFAGIYYNTRESIHATIFVSLALHTGSGSVSVGR
jgi:hypothetical protein